MTYIFKIEQIQIISLAYIYYTFIISYNTFFFRLNILVINVNNINMCSLFSLY